MGRRSARSVRRHPEGIDPRDHPIAPTEFPRGWSATETPGLPYGNDELRHTPPKRRIPYVGHVRRRLPTRACPQMSTELIAIGQPSTDSDDAGYKMQPVFGHPPRGCLTTATDPTPSSTTQRDYKPAFGPATGGQATKRIPALLSATAATHTQVVF
jgi:hypothetical protein